MNRAYLLLGSNIDKERNLVRGIQLLAQNQHVLAVSSVYETEPVVKPDQEQFLNAAMIIETSLSPVALKETVLRPIERKLVRKRTNDRYAPRTIDIDVVLFNSEVIHVDSLVIPDPDLLIHPHIAIPLAEIAPDYVHPKTGEKLAEIAGRFIPSVGIVKRYEPF